MGWEKGTITWTNMEVRSYEVKTDAGADYTRNGKHLRKSMEGPVLYDTPDLPYDNPNCTSKDNKVTNPEPNTNKDPWAFPLGPTGVCPGPNGVLEAPPDPLPTTGAPSNSKSWIHP